MENNKIAVGLDIGTTKIVAIIGRKNEYGKLEVLGVGKAKSLGVKRGVVIILHKQYSLFNKQLMKQRVFLVKKLLKLLPV